MTNKDSYIMHHKIRLLMYKIRFEVQICGSQYFTYQSSSKQVKKVKTHYSRCLRIKMLVAIQKSVVEPTSINKQFDVGCVVKFTGELHR